MSKFKVLLTDYAWPNVEIEANILAEAGIELIVAPNGDLDTLIDCGKDVDAIMTNWAATTAEVIGASGRVQIVARLGIGLDNIDVDFCTQNGIPVTNVPDYCLIEVAEHALAQILSLGRNLGIYHLDVKNGTYDLQAGPELRRLSEQTVGIVGWGNIGRVLAQKLLGINMRVIAFSRSRKDPLDGVEFVEFDQLLNEADYVSIHVPLTPDTHRMMNADCFQKMKSTAFLINTARGGVVDQAALWNALKNNQIAGAALDVQDPEPPNLNDPLFQDPRVMISPHAAFTSRESLTDLRTRVARQIIDCLEGRPPASIVNPEYASANPS